VEALSEEAAVVCPFCDGTDTKLFSPFGSQLSVSTYWCNACHTAFEKMKWTSSSQKNVSTPAEADSEPA
jgi:hypothetical protein